jgi:threonyl-tRNA synthetase
MLIVGEKEAENSEVSVRQRGIGDLGSMTVEVFSKINTKKQSKTAKLLTNA